MTEPTEPPSAVESPYVPPGDLALLANKALDMLCIAADGRLVAVNHAFERVLGWSAEELTSRPFLDFVHPDDVEATTATWLGLLDDAEVVDFENRYRHCDGGWRRLQWRSGRLDGGRFHAVARDVTNQTRERALIERTHRIARVGGWQLDFASRQIYWTSGTFRLHDLEPGSPQPELDQGLGFYLPEDRPRVAAAVERLAAEARPFDLEAQMRTARGRVITVRAEGIPIIEDGVVVGAFGAVGDITERRRVEHQMRRMEAVIQASPHAVLFFSPERRLQWFNPAAKALMGLDESDLGNHSTTYFSAATIARFDQYIMPSLRAEGSWRGRSETRAANGEFAPTRATVVLHRDPVSGKAQFISSTLEDLRHEHSLQQQVRHSQRLEGVGRLAGGLAHDFNNLLTVVMANGDELAHALGGTPLEPLAREILEAARKGASLTRRLLAYARRDVARPESIDLLAACVDLTRMLQRTLGEQIRVRVDPGPDNWPVFIDRTHLDQLLMNLAVNARDAMPAGGELCFALRALPGDGSTPARMQLTVSDTGHGMAPAVVEQAFDPFFTTKDHDRGTGLGLATCLGIVQQADGQIRIDSVEGRGTRVIVQLPRAPCQPPMRALTPAHPMPAIRGVQLAVIEDEAGIRRSLSKGLEAAGYRVQTFESGEQAVDAVSLARYQPQMIISDVILPGIDGPTAVRRMRAVLGPVPVIFASGYATDRLSSVDLADPTTRLISKPYTSRTVEPLIRELLA